MEGSPLSVSFTHHFKVVSDQAVEVLLVPHIELRTEEGCFCLVIISVSGEEINSRLCTHSAPCPSPLASWWRRRSPQSDAKLLSSPRPLRSCPTTHTLAPSHCSYRASDGDENLPVRLFAFTEVRFDNDGSTTICFYCYQQTFIVFLSQPERGDPQRENHSWTKQQKRRPCRFGPTFQGVPSPPWCAWSAWRYSPHDCSSQTPLSAPSWWFWI